MIVYLNAMQALITAGAGVAFLIFVFGLVDGKSSLNERRQRAVKTMLALVFLFDACDQGAGLATGGVLAYLEQGDAVNAFVWLSAVSRALLVMTLGVFAVWVIRFWWRDHYD